MILRIKRSFIECSSISETCRDYLARNQKVRLNLMIEDGIYGRSTNEKQKGIKLNMSWPLRKRGTSFKLKGILFKTLQ